MRASHTTQATTMHWEAFAAFAALQLLFALTPGPAVLFTVAHGMRSGWGASLKAGLGIQFGNGIYFTLSALGLGALLSTSETLFHAVKWVGAAYLMYLGFKAIRDARANAAPRGDAPVPVTQRPFAQGVLTQLANPKSVLFFGALMPQFVDPAAPLLPQYLLFGAICFVTEMPVLAVYGWVAAQGRRLAASERVAVWRERISGALLMGVGASLAAIRRAT
ncbi:MAG: LysE family translocator [Rehaibacterium terrae]